VITVDYRIKDRAVQQQSSHDKTRKTAEKPKTTKPVNKNNDAAEVLRVLLA